MIKIFRLTKKHALVLIILVLVLLCLSFGASGFIAPKSFSYAEELPKVTAESKTVHRGQTFSIDVDIENNTGLISLLLTLNYDTTAMTLVDVIRGDGLSSMTFTNTNSETSQGYSFVPFNFLWDGRTQDFTNGKLMTLTFESKITAVIGDYPLNITYSNENTNSEYGKPIDIIIETATITLISGEFEAIYKNYDETVLYSKDYNADDIPEYKGEKPQKQADDKYTYEFVTWKGVVSDSINKIIYEAVYKETPKTYQIFIYIDGINDMSFDGIIDDNDYYLAKECDYSSIISVINPTKKYYTFVGWFMDTDFKVHLTDLSMPASDLRLYGYFKYNVRDTLIPQITLSIDSQDENYVFIDVDLTQNYGLNGLVLTLDYNEDAMTFVDFSKGDALSSLQFDTTNVDQIGKATDFKFYWEYAENTYELGNILKLKFEIKKDIAPAIYPVSFSYNETSDVTYINEYKEIWYSKIDIIQANVSVGKIYQWKEKVQDDSVVTVKSDVGMSSDVVLKVVLVSTQIIPSEQKLVVLGNEKEIKSLYKITLEQNGVEIQPLGNLTISIQVCEEQKHSEELDLYFVDKDSKMDLYSSFFDGSTLSFTTDHLSLWAIVGDVKPDKNLKTGTLVLMIGLPILLAIVTMAYVLILIGRNKKNKLQNL